MRPSAYTVPMREIDGAGTCGMDHPFKVLGVDQGRVQVTPAATLACPATAAVDRWVTDTVQPAAMAWFGQPVVQIKQMSSYSCRNMNGAATGKTSEHAYGNALDVGGFVLADGRQVIVQTGWKGAVDEQGFLRTVQATACERFTTVLAPGSNIYHYNHIHVDLMRHKGSSICKPGPVMPRPPMIAAPMTPPAGSGMPVPLPAAATMGAPVRQQAQPYPGGPAEIPPGDGDDSDIGAQPSYGAPPPPQPTYSAPAAQGYPPAPNAPATGYPARNPYPPAGGYVPPKQAPAPAVRPMPNGVPLPPSGIPMVRRQPTDPLVTGSVAANRTRSYAQESPAERPARKPWSFITPIEPPSAVAGED
ncbi:extensin family protein [Ancylobacter sp. 6x-1]|uniref:Extensin family protein n=1 Tax=Ancylobacter crimeensis TaxID=2579147 RepID=A0ABT0DE06_9HYPH|nr:extensin family protein [Ancylobacter crimeensis]